MVIASQAHPLILITQGVVVEGNQPLCEHLCFIWSHKDYNNSLGMCWVCLSLTDTHTHAITPSLINRCSIGHVLEREEFTFWTGKYHCFSSPSKFICYPIHRCLSCLPSFSLCCHGYAIPMATAGLYGWPRAPTVEDSLNLSLHIPFKLTDKSHK